MPQVKKKIEDCFPGQDNLELQAWFTETYSADWIEQIEQAEYQYEEEYWHDENNSECEDEDDCSCPEPDSTKVAAGKVWRHIQDEYVVIKSLEIAPASVYAKVTIDFDDDDVPKEMTIFNIPLGTVVETSDWEDEDAADDEPASGQNSPVMDVGGPLQPPKQAFRAFPLLRQQI